MAASLPSNKPAGYMCEFIDLTVCKYGGHMGRCPTKNLKTISCSISLRARDQSVSKAASIPFIIHMQGQFDAKL